MLASEDGLATKCAFHNSYVDASECQLRTILPCRHIWVLDEACAALSPPRPPSLREGGAAWSMSRMLPLTK